LPPLFPRFFATRAEAGEYVFISMPPLSRPAAPFKKRRSSQGPALLICGFVVAAIAYASRNSGGFLGLLGFNSSSSQPVDMPSWMTKPFDKQEPLNHTVYPYAEEVHACCKKGSSKCLKVTFRCSQQPPSVSLLSTTSICFAALNNLHLFRCSQQPPSVTFRCSQQPPSVSLLSTTSICFAALNNLHLSRFAALNNLHLHVSLLSTTSICHVSLLSTTSICCQHCS
jgi:hypothetical protein